MTLYIYLACYILDERVGLRVRSAPDERNHGHGIWLTQRLEDLKTESRGIYGMFRV